MGKESKKGHEFYASKGMRGLLIYLPVLKAEKLRKYAKKQNRTVQYYARKAILRFVDAL